MGEGSGQSRNPKKVQRFILLSVRGDCVGEKKLILLVEDNPDDEELTIRALRQNDVVSKIIVAHDGQEAVEMLFGPERASPDLILLDLKLPKLGGLDILDRIRHVADTSLLPVVVLTSSSEEQDILRSYERGANSYVRKPVAYSDFQNAVKQLGVYWLTVNQTPRLDQQWDSRN